MIMLYAPPLFCPNPLGFMEMELVRENTDGFRGAANTGIFLEGFEVLGEVPLTVLIKHYEPLAMLIIGRKTLSISV